MIITTAAILYTRIKNRNAHHRTIGETPPAQQQETRVNNNHPEKSHSLSEILGNLRLTKRRNTGDSGESTRTDKRVNG